MDIILKVFYLQWSYGVLMWEIFTNGDHPYKELENEDLAEYLRQGERLGKPDMAWSEM